MKWLAALVLTLSVAPSMACDVCGIFLAIQPHGRTSSISLLWRARLMEGTLTWSGTALDPAKHGGHGNEAITLTGSDHYREVYQVLELRADLWLTERFALLVSAPAVNNYRAVNGYIGTDVYGLGDPLLLGRYLVANTKCTTTDDEDFHIDLLFFHRDLNRLVAIELKLGDFKPDHKGQMELYLRWLDKYERRPGEEPPMGLILCAGKKQERIELLELGRSGIHVAEYLTVLPSKKVLQEKLHKAIEHARLRLNETN